MSRHPRGFQSLTFLSPVFLLSLTTLFFYLIVMKIVLLVNIFIIYFCVDVLLSEGC